MDANESSLQQQSVQQPTNQPVNSKSDPFNKVLLIMLAVLILLAVAAGSYYLGSKQEPSEKMMTTSSPTLAPIISPTPTPDPTVDWQVYTNTKYTISLKYPPNLTVNEVNSPFYYVEFKGGDSTLPRFVVSAIGSTFVATDVVGYDYMSSDWINNIVNVPVGQSKTMDSTATFTRLPDIQLAGQMAWVIQVTATGYKQHRVYIKNNGSIYMLSNFYQNDSDLNDFNLFLSTFKFTQ